MLRLAVVTGVLGLSALSTDVQVNYNCQSTDLELTVLTDGSPKFPSADIVKALSSISGAFSSLKVAVGSYGEKPESPTDDAACYRLVSPLTPLTTEASFFLPDTSPISTAHPQAHLEAVINAVVDNRVGWSLRPEDESHHLIKAVILLTNSVGLSGSENPPTLQETPLQPFNLNNLRLDSATHCAAHQYPEYADVAQVLRRGKTNLIVGLLSNDETINKTWKWASTDQKYGLGTADVKLVNIKSAQDISKVVSKAVAEISRCSGISAMAFEESAFERQCESDCDCVENPECSCCSGFKVVLRLPMEPKDIEIKVTH